MRVRAIHRSNVTTDIPQISIGIICDIDCHFKNIFIVIINFFDDSPQSCSHTIRRCTSLRHESSTRNRYLNPAPFSADCVASPAVENLRSLRYLHNRDQYSIDGYVLGEYAGHQ